MMIPKLKAIERFGHYMKIMPVNTGLSPAQEIDFAKQCAKSECEEILQTNPTIKGTSDDLLTQIVQTKAYYYQVIDEISKIV